MIAMLLLAALASTPPSAAARAAALTRRAIVEYNGGDFDEALADAKSAYALRPAAGLLFDMGQCQRALHRWAEAAAAFRSYLRERPHAANRAAVEAFIAEMDSRRLQEGSGPQAPFQSPDTAAPTPPPSPGLLPALEEPSPAAPEREPAPPAANVPRIAVLDVRAYGSTSDDFAQAVTSIVLLDVRKHAASSTVQGSDEIRALLGLARGKRVTDCPGGACLLGIAETLRPDRFVLGSLNRLGDTYLLDLEFYDSATASVVASGSARFKSESALPQAVAHSVQALFPK